MSDVIIVDAIDSDLRPIPHREHRFSRPATAIGLVVGSVVIWLALAPLGSLPGLAKVPLVLVGVAGVFVSVRGLARSYLGAAFDLGYWLCLLWLLGLTLATALAGLLPLGNHDDVAKALTDPANQSPDLLSAHPLGTNGAALDILSRSIYAARVSLGTAGLAVVISLTVGVILGTLAGYRGGMIDRVVSIVTDTSLAIPGLVLLIAMAAVLGVPTSVPSAILKEGFALALVSTPTMIRLARANTIAIANRDFVVASRCLGASDGTIIRRHLLPNVLVPLISYAFIILAVLIVAEGSLAFLGLGLQQPHPTWGNMIAEGSLDVLRRHPFIPIVPGVFMFLTVFSLNRVGERLREAVV